MIQLTAAYTSFGMTGSNSVASGRTRTRGFLPDGQAF